jgi:hypothetical protein
MMYRRFSDKLDRLFLRYPTFDGVFMPRNSTGTITAKTTPSSEPQYQTHPPVCNRCGQKITKQNFGWAYRVHDGGKTQEVEFIECTACTPVREGGKALRAFVARHELFTVTDEERINFSHALD